MITCLACKGTKTTEVTVHLNNEPPKQMKLRCIDCDGKGEMTPKDQERYLHMKEMMVHFWCACGNPSGNVTFHDDAPGSKHHWTCDDCGKVTQVG